MAIGFAVNVQLGRDHGSQAGLLYVPLHCDCTDFSCTQVGVFSGIWSVVCVRTVECRLRSGTLGVARLHIVWDRVER